MGEAALQRARDRFTVERMVQETLAMYETFARVARGRSASSRSRRSRKRRSGSCLVSASARAYDSRASAVRPRRRHRSARAECARW